MSPPYFRPTSGKFGELPGSWGLLTALTVGGLLSACGAILPAPAPASATPRGPAATIGLPATWTPTITLTPSATRPPSETPVPSRTPTPRPTFTPSPTRPTATPSPTPDLSSPKGVVEAAFAAHLNHDEDTLRALYDDAGERFCDLVSTSMSRCISSAYRRQGLSGLQEWWVDGDVDSARGLAFLFVYSRWSSSSDVWAQLFSVIRDGSDWLIYENQTQVYRAGDQGGG